MWLLIQVPTQQVGTTNNNDYWQRNEVVNRILSTWQNSLIAHRPICSLTTMAHMTQML